MRKQRSSVLELSVYTGNVVSSNLYGMSHLLTIDSVYQEYLAKILTDKYGTLSVQMDKVINDANAEIENLHHKLEGRSQTLLFFE